MDAGHLLGPGGPLAREVPGYEHRPGQIEMAGSIQAALEHDGILAIEAGTGTGKTWAYLVPAIESGRRVMVSTGTRALQDQIMEKDLPALRRHLGLEISAACVKGLSNYLCRRRYLEFLGSAEASSPRFSNAVPLLRDWVDISPTGDRATLPTIAEDDPIWARVVSGPDTRIGVRCDFYEECFATAVRRRAETAQLVIVNHHLFFADLALRDTGFASVLPDYDVVIFDEAHQIEDTATVFFGSRLSVPMIERLCRDARAAWTRQRQSDDLERTLTSILQRSSNLFGSLPGRSDGGRVSLVPSDIPQDELFGLDNALAALGASCRTIRPPEERILQIARRTDQMRGTLGALEATDQVCWSQGASRNRSVGSSPIDVGPLLRERLHLRVPALVFTSATLTTSGSFSFFKQRLGLPDEIDEQVVDSPFRYQDQAALYAPAHLPDPRSDRYLEAANRELLALLDITKGGAFVLCTSVRMMRSLAQSYRETVGEDPLLQGDAPKQALLQSFRDHGDAILFATASFWEGVDVPGSALRLVVLDKLPFEVPTDPIVAARCRRLEEGQQSPFMKYLVPSAALSLKQGFGRLIRTARDRGIVAVLDSRLRNRGYGKVLLRSLPPARLCTELDEVRRFWTRDAD